MHVHCADCDHLSKDDKALHLYRETDWSLREIASHLSISESTVMRILEKYSEPRRPKERKFLTLCTTKGETIVKGYLEGKSLKGLSEDHNLDPRMTSRILRARGVDPGKPGWGQRGARNWQWKEGRRLNSNGYVDLLLDPSDLFLDMADRRRRILEHRYVMAQHLGRPLGSHETIHHKNGIRDDNRLENLELRIGAHGPGVIATCCDCGSRNISFMDLSNG